MKKQLFYSIILAFASIGVGKAQITITLADMPQVGTNIVTSTDTAYGGSAGSIGTNQTWNHSGLLNHGINSYSFVAVSGQPGASNFSGANLCMPAPADSMWQYLTTSASGVFMNGLYNTSTSFPAPVVKFNPPMQLIKLPCTYNTTFINTAKASIKFALASPPIDSMDLRQTVNQSGIIDAWGSLTTPTGTYNALRQKRTDLSTDSTFYYAFGSWIFSSEDKDTTVNYTWWANSIHYPVLEMDQGDNDATYLLSNVTGLKDVSHIGFSILAYPNPAATEMNFVLPEGQAKLQILDITGKVVSSYDVNGGEMKIDVSNLQNGAYSFAYLTVDGNNLRGKLVVNH